MVIANEYLCIFECQTNEFWCFAFLEGEIWAWGLNNYGQLGVGNAMKKIANPTKIASLDGIPIAYIACGSYHSFAISK